MSRSALWRGADKQQQRKSAAVELVDACRAEGFEGTKKGDIPLIGNCETYNLNVMLSNNVISSGYFLKLCEKIKDWKTLIDEIYYNVNHCAPWTPGTTKIPSSAFCCLYRLFTMRLSEKQMHAMLSHLDSPYIRVLGFLYLRYAAQPETLWKWVSPFVFDTEEFVITTNPIRKITIGVLVRNLINEIDFYGTILPRLPTNIQREYKVKLLVAKEDEDRKKTHIKNNKVDKIFYKNANVRGLYEDEENPRAWYDCIIDSVEAPVHEWETPKYWVTFTEYGNSELLSLGQIDERIKEVVVDDNKNSSKTANSGYGSELLTTASTIHNSSVNTTTASSAQPSSSSDLMAEVLRQERESSSTSGRNFSRQHTSYNNSMSSNMAGDQKRKRSRSPEQKYQTYTPTGSGAVSPVNGDVGINKKGRNDDEVVVEKKPAVVLSKEKLAEIGEKKRLLANKYG